ncbi:hypothetical protein ACFL96_00875 [Thermoproteota archaeon]
MLTGKEKAQLLLSILEDKAKDILGQLTKESAQLLTETIEDLPKTDPKVVNSVVTEVLEKVEAESLGKSMWEQPKLIETTDMDATKTAEMPEMKPDTIADSSMEPEAPVGAEGIMESDKGPISSQLEEQSLSAKPIEAVPSVSEFRSMSEAASILSEQRPQLAAFFLDRLEDEETKEAILHYLPEDFKKKIQTRRVDNIPIADAIFENLYNSLFKAPVLESE